MLFILPGHLSNIKLKIIITIIKRDLHENGKQFLFKEAVQNSTWSIGDW